MSTDLDLGAKRGAAAGWLLDPSSSVRRHYEDLANNLLSVGEGVKSVVVTSPEPGAGCTSVCIGLGAALAGMVAGRPSSTATSRTRSCTGCSANPTSSA